MNSYIETFKKFAVFCGRARRQEYWIFLIVNTLIFNVLSFLGYFSNESIFGLLGILLFLITIVPSISVLVRRLHDTNRSGGWVFISLVPIIGVIVLFVFTLLDSTPGDNTYGPNPKGVVNNNPVSA